MAISKLKQYTKQDLETIELNYDIKFINRWLYDNTKKRIADN